jgi:hypothetical protein
MGISAPGRLAPARTLKGSGHDAHLGPWPTGSLCRGRAVQAGAAAPGAERTRVRGRATQQVRWTGRRRGARGVTAHGASRRTGRHGARHGATAVSRMYAAMGGCHGCHADSHQPEGSAGRTRPTVCLGTRRCVSLQVDCRSTRTPHTGPAGGPGPSCRPGRYRTEPDSEGLRVRVRVTQAQAGGRAASSESLYSRRRPPVPVTRSHAARNSNELRCADYIIKIACNRFGSLNGRLTLAWTQRLPGRSLQHCPSHRVSLSHGRHQ